MTARWTSLLAGVALVAGSFAGAAAGPSTDTASAAPAARSADRPLPSKDPFYRYTGRTPLRRIAPGTVLKKRTVDVSLGTDGSPVKADQLLYRTRDERGTPSVTVTTVVPPQAAQAPTRILAYLSFYDALGSECDPSYTLAGGYAGSSSNEQQAEIEEGLISSYLSQGYVVTIPDFEGTHLHWAAGQESGWDTLDALKATEHDLRVPRSTAAGLSGYSGGSIAAEWASELAPHYTPHLHLVGVAEGGIPVDFAHNLHYINGSKDWSGVIPAVLVSLTRAFHVHHRQHYLSKKGRRITHQVRHQCIGSFLGSYPGLTVQSLLKHRYRHFLRIPRFARIVNHLIMGRTRGHPHTPLFMGVGNTDGTGDGVMVARDVEALAHEYCTQGVAVSLATYQGSNHDQAAVHFEPAASKFLQQRFAGVPFSGGCGSIGKGNSLKPLPVHRRHHRRHH